MRRLIAIVLTILLIVGIIAYVDNSQDDLNKLEYIRSKWSSWPTTQGRIIDSEIITEPAPNGEGYEKLRVAFQYRVNEILYEKKQSRYVAWQVEEQLKEYRAGNPVTVYYDPAEPQISVIEPTKIPDEWTAAGQVYAPAIGWGILGCILIWGSVYGTSDWLRQRRNRKRERS